MPTEPQKDPQDQQFGEAAREDQEAVDRLAEEGVTEDELSDEPARAPRAGAKAEPAPGQEQHAHTQ